MRAWHRALEGTDKADVALLDRATRDARAALAIDPNSTLALHAIAYAQGSRLYLRLAIDPGNASEEIAEAAARALAIDDGDPRGYALRALAVVRGGRYERYADALGDARRAHELNPNDTFVLHTLGMLECGIGDTDWALDCARRILRLSPREPRIHAVWNLMAVAHCRAGRYEEGIQWETRVVNDMPRMAAAHNILVVCLVGAGRIEEAKAAFATAWAVAPEYFLWRLDGRSFFALAEPNRRVVTFLRIAAGLEDPGAADALR